MVPSRLPPTERLHAEDSYRLTFEARVVGVRAAGERLIDVALEASAFYAESGGQPSDRGTLGGAEVLAVRAEEGIVWHRVSSADAKVAAAFLPGSRVAGTVDAATRLDHLQQHTGQHILSQAFARCAALPTVGFHLGREDSTIDLRGEKPGPEQIESVLVEANECVLADRAVRVHFVAREELDRYPLRRDPTAEEDVLRLIEIEGYDWSACGGTHARRTGEVGPIQVLGVERIRGDWRIRFVAGRRALAYLRAAHRLLDETARAHSLHWTAIPAAAGAWKEAAAEARREVRRLRLERGAREGERLWREAPVTPSGWRVAAFWSEEATADELRALATRFTESGAGTILAGAREGDRCAWVAASRSADPAPDGAASPSRDAASAPPGPPPADALLRAWLGPLDGRGGGNAAFARGTSPAGALAGPEWASRLAVWLADRLGTGPQKRMENGLGAAD